MSKTRTASSIVAMNKAFDIDEKKPKMEEPFSFITKLQAQGEKKAKAVPVDTTPAHETAIDKALRTTREALDKAEAAVHDANNPKTLAVAERAMKLAEKHYSAAYKAHEKGK